MYKSRTEKLKSMAEEILLASGVDATKEVMPEKRRELCKALASRGKCHITTAKTHMARAFRRARHPDYVPPKHGGARAGAGRPKSEELDTIHELETN